MADRNGSFQNPPDEIPRSRSKRHATSSTWTELKKRKSPRGDSLAGGMKCWQKNNDRETEKVMCLLALLRLHFIEKDEKTMHKLIAKFVIN